MPLNQYYGGHGAAVMKSMQQTYGKDAKRVFYATANKQKARRERGRGSLLAERK